MAKIIIHRKLQWVDGARAYKILIDGQMAGRIRAGKSLELEVSEGSHEVQLKIDWCYSNPLQINLDKQTILEFECGNPITRWKIIMSFIYIFINVTIRRKNYLWLKQL